MSTTYFLLREFGNLGILAVGCGYFGKLFHICTRKESTIHYTSDELLASTSQACLRTKETEVEMGQKHFFSLLFSHI